MRAACGCSLLLWAVAADTSGEMYRQASALPAPIQGATCPGLCLQCTAVLFTAKAIPSGLDGGSCIQATPRIFRCLILQLQLCGSCCHWSLMAVSPSLFEQGPPLACRQAARGMHPHTPAGGSIRPFVTCP